MPTAVTICFGCCDHSFCIESRRRGWCRHWLSLTWVTKTWMSEEEVQQALSERIGKAKPLFWGGMQRNRETHGVEYRFILGKEGQTVPFSSEEIRNLEQPPNWLGHQAVRRPDQCYVTRFPCCLREIRGPLLELSSYLDEPGVESFGCAALYSDLQRELTQLPAVVV